MLKELTRNCLSGKFCLFHVFINPINGRTRRSRLTYVYTSSEFSRSSVLLANTWISKISPGCERSVKFFI